MWIRFNHRDSVGKKTDVLYTVLDGEVDNECGSLYAPAADSSGHQQM